MRSGVECGGGESLCWWAAVVVPSRFWSAITLDGSASSNLGAWSRSSRQTMHCSAMLNIKKVVVVAGGGVEEHKVTFRDKSWSGGCGGIGEIGE